MSQHHADRPDVPRSSLNPETPSSARLAPRTTLPPYRVILHVDAASDLMHVVRTIMELTRFCRAEATHKMWEANHQGRSVLLTTYLERAELYQEQFQSRALRIALEPA